jgi:hypothetical protein
MPDYNAFFLNTAGSVVQLETIEISHPSFSQTYRIVRNAIFGMSATLEDTTLQNFTYYPLRLTPSKASDDLDQAIKVDLGDLGQVVPQELDNVNAASTFLTKPVFKYRTYRSDDLSAPLFGPLVLAITNLSFTKQGCSFNAEAPKVNINSTGESYTINRFPMMKGFL